MLGVSFLTLEAELQSDGSIKRNSQGEPIFPRLRSFTRNEKEYPQHFRKRDWFFWEHEESKRTYVLAADILFMKALFNTVVFVAVVAPLQAGLALLLALLINQPLRGINFFRTIYFMPVVISMVVVSMLWRFIYDGQNGLLNSLLDMFSFGVIPPIDWLGESLHGPVCDHRYVCVAGCRFSYGDLAFRTPNYSWRSLRSCEDRRSISMASLSLCHLARTAKHSNPGDGHHYHAGLYALSSSAGNDTRRSVGFHSITRVSDGNSWL